MFSMFKTAWDPAWGSPISLSRSRSISQSRDSGYSSAELPSSPREHHHHEEPGDDEQSRRRRRQRSIYSRHHPFHPLDVDAIFLSPLTPTASASASPEQHEQQPQQPRPHYVRPTRKTKPSTSFTIGVHARAHARAQARAHARSRSINSAKSAATTPATAPDRASLLRALTGHTSTAQTIISGGGHPIPGLPLSMPATPVRAGTPQPQPQPQPQPECPCGGGGGAGGAGAWVTSTTDTPEDPAANADPSNDVIWRTREFCVRYEDEDEADDATTATATERDHDHPDLGGPGPAVPGSPVESTAVYDEEAAEGLQLFDVGGILAGRHQDQAGGSAGGGTSP
ncbi:hypothetical protein VTN02DRAFT_5729 [Thermoascus thermophilus]